MTISLLGSAGNLGEGGCSVSPTTVCVWRLAHSTQDSNISSAAFVRYKVATVTLAVDTPWAGAGAV